MAWDAAWPQGVQGGRGWVHPSCGHLPAPVMSQGAPQPKRVSSSHPHRWWGQGGAQQGLGMAWLGPLSPCWAQLILLTGGPAAAGALALHLLLILTQWYVCADPSCLPKPHTGQVMASAKPRGSQRTRPALAEPGCHPCATDLSCTSPSLSVQSPVLPLLSRSPSETNLASPVEPLGAPVPLRSPTGTSAGRAGTFTALGLPAPRWLQAPGAWAGVRGGPGGCS